MVTVIQIDYKLFVYLDYSIWMMLLLYWRVEYSVFRGHFTAEIVTAQTALKVLLQQIESLQQMHNKLHTASPQKFESVQQIRNTLT